MRIYFLTCINRGLKSGEIGSTDWNLLNRLGIRERQTHGPECKGRPRPRLLSFLEILDTQISCCFMTKLQLNFSTPVRFKSRGSQSLKPTSISQGSSGYEKKKKKILQGFLQGLRVGNHWPKHLANGYTKEAMNRNISAVARGCPNTREKEREKK